MINLVRQLEGDLSCLMAAISPVARLNNPELDRLYWGVRASFMRGTFPVSAIVTGMEEILWEIPEEEFRTNRFLRQEVYIVRRKLLRIKEARKRLQDIARWTERKSKFAFRQ